MAAVQKVYTVLKSLAPLELAESWDNPGLLVDSGVPVTHILVTLDITIDVVNEAAAAGCELIVSHHPVIFDPLKKLSREDVVYRLVQKGISAICMHTNLDAAEGGVNDVLAAFFDLRDAVPFAGGCGRVGSIKETTAEALATKASAVLHTHVKFADSGKPIRRLAVISGGGGSLFQDAIAVGADALLTGEANHHAGLDATRCGLSLVVATHYATEWPIVPVLAEKICAALPDVQAVQSRVCRDPFCYL